MTLNVIDIAHPYQAGINIKACPADAIIIKISEGTGYLNPLRKEWTRSIIANNKKLGFYHFLLPGNIKGQADYFIKEIEPYIGQAMLFADVESSKYGHATPAEAKQFMDYVYNKTGVKPLLYTNVSDLNSYDFSAIAKADYGLWLAQYNDMRLHTGFNPGIKIYGHVRFWKIVALHQYSSTTRITGFSGNIDVSVFAGDRSTWDAYAKQLKNVAPLPSKTQPKPQPKPQPKYFVDALGVRWYYEKATFTANTAIKMRWGALVTSDLLTVIKPGDKIKYDCYAFSGGYVWIRQPRGNGKFAYLATGEQRNGRRVSSWGTFK